LNLSGPDLDAARRQWLDGLAREHRERDTAATAFALAQGEWRCGEYDGAIVHFTEARDRAPEAAEPHLALLRCAAMLGSHALEAAALSLALDRHAEHPGIALHAALVDVPNDLERARQRLSRVSADAACAEFAQALDVIAGAAPPAPTPADPAARARQAALAWALRHAPSTAVHQGLPDRVLQRALDEAPAAGLTLECGVYYGRSLRLIAARTPGMVHGFDSFEGLPEAWSAAEGAGAYSTGGRMPAVASNVTLHRGWFEDSLPPFLEANPGPVRLLHIDCDLYSSTRTVLDALAARLVPGSVLVFDDMLAYPGFEQHELRAFEELVAGRGIGWELVAACLLGREVAVRITRT
jgi:hypothetical protein